jgi:hypothetical protein
LYGVGARESAAPGSALPFTPIEFAVGAVQIAAQVAPLFITQAVALAVIPPGDGPLLLPPFPFVSGGLSRRTTPVLSLLQTGPEVPRRGHGRLKPQHYADREHAQQRFHPISPVGGITRRTRGVPARHYRKSTAIANRANRGARGTSCVIAS